MFYCEREKLVFDLKKDWIEMCLFEQLRKTVKVRSERLRFVFEKVWPKFWNRFSSRHVCGVLMFSAQAAHGLRIPPFVLALGEHANYWITHFYSVKVWQQNWNRKINVLTFCFTSDVSNTWYVQLLQETRILVLHNGFQNNKYIYSKPSVSFFLRE